MSKLSSQTLGLCLIQREAPHNSINAGGVSFSDLVLPFMRSTIGGDRTQQTTLLMQEVAFYCGDEPRCRP
jgi:hypothetical protein